MKKIAVVLLLTLFCNPSLFGSELSSSESGEDLPEPEIELSTSALQGRLKDAIFESNTSEIDRLLPQFAGRDLEICSFHSQGMSLTITPFHIAMVHKNKSVIKMLVAHLVSVRLPGLSDRLTRLLDGLHRDVDVNHNIEAQQIADFFILHGALTESNARIVDTSNFHDRIFKMVMYQATIDSQINNIRSAAFTCFDVTMSDSDQVVRSKELFEFASQRRKSQLEEAVVVSCDSVMSGCFPRDFARLQEEFEQSQSK